MDFRTVVVPVADLGLLQVAIDLGGGTITHSLKLDHGDVVVTYVATDPCLPRRVGRTASQSGG